MPRTTSMRLEVMASLLFIKLRAHTRGVVGFFSLD